MGWSAYETVTQKAVPVEGVLGIGATQAHAGCAALIHAQDSQCLSSTRSMCTVVRADPFF